MFLCKTIIFQGRAVKTLGGCYFDKRFRSSGWTSNFVQLWFGSFPYWAAKTRTGLWWEKKTTKKTPPFLALCRRLAPGNCKEFSKYVVTWLTGVSIKQSSIVLHQKLNPSFTVCFTTLLISWFSLPHGISSRYHVGFREVDPTHFFRRFNSTPEITQSGLSAYALFQSTAHLPHLSIEVNKPQWAAAKKRGSGTSWWLNQPLWKILVLYSQIGSFPQVVVKIKSIWNQNADL